MGSDPIMAEANTKPHRDGERRTASARDMETGMLTQMPDTRALGKAFAPGFEDDPQGAAPLRLCHRIARAGEAVVEIRGELDITTAEAAVTYVRNTTVPISLGVLAL